MKIIIVALRVLDQDSALKFYSKTLGFTVTEDMDLGGMRWLTVTPPGQPELNVLLDRNAYNRGTGREAEVGKHDRVDQVVGEQIAKHRQ